MRPYYVRLFFIVLSCKEDKKINDDTEIMGAATVKATDAEMSMCSLNYSLLVYTYKNQLKAKNSY